jgi:tricorn protease
MPRLTTRSAATILTLFLLLFGVQEVRADIIHFARYPAISNDGSIAFSFHGDIWIANSDGTNPRRLTAHVARDINPRFSPDGKWIAFSSNRMGNNDVFVMPVTGGEPKQLTWFSGADNVVNWTPDGKSIVFSTGRGTYPWGSPLYVVSTEGGMPSPLPMDQASTGMISQNGGMIAFNRTSYTYWRKGYKGNSATDLDVMDLKTGDIRQITHTNLKDFRTFRRDEQPMWGADGNIYFMSERDDVFNIWRIAPSGGEPVQVTHHKSDGVQFPSISPDGRHIIYENEFDLWTLDVPSGQPKRIVLNLAFDPKTNTTQFLTTSGLADDFSPSPRGDYVALSWHGEMFNVPVNPDSGEVTQMTRSPWRDRFVDYSPDGKSVAYISDESGEEELWVYDVGTGARRKLSTHQSIKGSHLWSPNSSKILMIAANRMFEFDVASGRSSEIGYNVHGGYQGVSYSPDGKWLTYRRQDENLNGDVYVMELATKAEHNVTDNPFSDSNPAFTPDGKSIVFESTRDGGVPHLFTVALQRLTADPADPLTRAAAAPKGDSASKAVPATVLQMDGIDKRARQLTTGAYGDDEYFISRDGRTIYFTGSDKDGAALFSVGTDGKDRKKVVAGTYNTVIPTADTKAFFYEQGNGASTEIWKMTLAGAKKDRVNFNLRVKVDSREEWEQIFDDAWRSMKYRFYDEKMHGRDWDALKKVYKPLLQYAGSNEDVYDIANEMIGELNASHNGVSGPPSYTIDAAYQTRHLGFELSPSNGRYRIDHIYRDGPADKEWLGLKVGDYVLAVDNQQLKAGDNFWQILNETVNEYVPVQVASDASGRGSRMVRIKAVPQSAVNELRYEEWVAGNREFVDRETNGQIAYVHIRAMNQPSLERFQNEINQFWNRKGIIVDIRFNGGGNIDQQLIDILERRPYEYWNNRWGSPASGRRPQQAIAGPKVMLTNGRSASDSEVTPQGFRDLGLGRIVGNPTSAAVIATGSYGLINGGAIRTPGAKVMTYDPTKPNNYGFNLENFGVEPDVMVKNSAMDMKRGFDRELKAAIDEVMRMLGTGKWQFAETGR